MKTTRIMTKKDKTATDIARARTFVQGVPEGTGQISSGNSRDACCDTFQTYSSVQFNPRGEV